MSATAAPQPAAAGSPDQDRLAAAVAEFRAWLESDYLAPVRAQIAADEDLARGHCGSYG